VFRGASACKVPTLVGVTKDQAVAALQASGCDVGAQKAVFSGTVKVGGVVAQAAAPGTLLA
jgi:beta-lactam-binding protein with PASTA domain